MGEIYLCQIPLNAISHSVYLNETFGHSISISVNCVIF